jgi:hypothetical protein
MNETCSIPHELTRFAEAYCSQTSRRRSIGKTPFPSFVAVGPIFTIIPVAARYIGDSGKAFKSAFADLE